MTATYRFDEMTGKKANTGNLLPAGGGIPVALTVEKMPRLNASAPVT
jgi:hypothetical protein